jgi:hypothetical protein
VGFASLVDFEVQGEEGMASSTVPSLKIMRNCASKYLEGVLKAYTFCFAIAILLTPSFGVLLHVCQIY